MVRTALVLAGLFLAAGLAWYFTSNVRQHAATYTAADQCYGCHSEIHRSYQHVGMARSFRPVGSESASGSFLHKKSGRHYQVLSREGKLVQRRYELDASGREIHAFELQATHVIGSGNHARSYLHRTNDGEIIQLPLTWYNQEKHSQEKSWGMSPGYDNAAPPDFTRLVDDSCLFCHNGYPQDGGKLAEGIDCQRCHGPGSLHVESPSKTNILNPKKVSPELQMDICMQCHLETTSAELPQMLRRFDRTIFSFRPGEPLGSYMVHFDHPPGAGHDDKFEIVNQAYRLRQSACFKESDGRLTCSSCHNPHAVPRGAAAVSHYRDKCMGCHSSLDRAGHPDLRTADCISCHMPLRRAEDAVHVVMTDHLIQRRRPVQDLTRPIAEHAATYHGPLVVYYPPNLPERERDVYLGVALISAGADRQRGIALLEKAAQRQIPAKALAVLAEGHLAQGNAESAIGIFQQALAKEPGLTKARYNLGQALEAAGRLPEARTALEQAIQSRPAFPEVEYALANLLVKTGDRALAEQHYRQAIRLRPVFAEAHNNLARLLALENRVAEALERARRAVALDLGYLEARYNLARLLQETGETNAALAEYQRVIAMKPGMIEAHLGLGQALGDAGQLDGAIAEFRKVLQLNAGHGEAQKNLDLALSMKSGHAR